AQGRGSLMAIAGEAGIGKSTLLQHLNAKVAAGRGIWIEAQCAPERSSAPLLALREALHGLSVDPDSAAARALEVLDGHERDLLKGCFRHRAADAPQPVPRRRRAVGCSRHWRASCPQWAGADHWCLPSRISTGPTTPLCSSSRPFATGCPPLAR